MARKKNKIRFGRLFVFIILLIFVGYNVFNVLKPSDNKVIESSKDKVSFLASPSYKVKLYDLNFLESGEAVRGEKVSLYEQEFKDESNDIYRKVKYNKKNYLVKKENIVDKHENCVLEDKVYVKTATTLYKDDQSGDIVLGVKKASELSVIGFNKINDDGSVDMYKVNINDKEGFVYSKYLVITSEEANKNYDEENTYKAHSSRGDTLGGGSAGDLDFYPVVKPEFADNKLPKESRTLYLNSSVLGNIDNYIALAKSNNINAFVVDIKDNTAPGYASDVMKELSPTNYAKAINTFDDYKKVIQKIKDADFYVIGRITVFKDSYYINDHPDTAITSKATEKPYSHNGSYWPSPYVRSVWEFNVKLAKEAVVKMGFNEIQFDYVRFPDRMQTVENQGLVDMKNSYNETKSQAIQQFLMYACDEIHKVGAYVSVDVFGESANSYVTAYGQYWGAISNVVDVISGMPYPDHFETYAYNSSVPVWTQPYTLMKNWGASVVDRQKEVPTPAIVRTWIQAYNAMHPPYTIYDATKISDQIKGLYENGLTGGYITWNASSNINKYQEIASAFRKSY